MNKELEKYIHHTQKVLEVQFQSIRDAFSDSDTKGGKNEQTFGRLIEKNFDLKYISYGNQIIDSEGNISEETDIIVNNKYQPFANESEQPVIAEGVDFTVQVKSQITSSEVPRIINNCSKVKRLKRKRDVSDTIANVFLEDFPYFVDTIPYFVFAFESQLKLETIAKKLEEAYKDVDLEEQVDAIFVLNKGFILNCRKGEGKVPRDVQGNPFIGFSAIYQQEGILLEFFRFVYSIIPNFLRMKLPIRYYFDFGLENKPSEIITKVKQES